MCENIKTTEEEITLEEYEEDQRILHENYKEGEETNDVPF